jgi:predicted transposase/invertase (TIGR01784 family)
MGRFNPLNDYLFLKLMGEEGDEEQCLAFLNAVLISKSLKPVKLVKILENKTFTAEVIGEKSSILDVRVEADNGEKINIEVQLEDLYNMEKRTLMYWGREFTKGIPSGGNYKDLPKVITINIVNFDNIKLDDFHTCFHLWEDVHRDYMLTDVLEIHFINMVKFRKLKTGDIANNLLERWLTFLDVNTPEETLQEVIKMDSAISKANERLNFVTQDKEFLRNYHLREMAMSDWTTGINTATEKGIGIGIEKGAMQSKIEIARNMFNDELPVEIIHKYTGLDMETIQSLK